MLLSKFLLIVILAACVYLAMSVFERYKVERQMAQRQEAAVQEYKNLQNRRDVLQEKVEYLQGESGVESEIRRHFDVVKEGEKVVIIVDDSSEGDLSGDNTGEKDVQEEKKRPWYKFW